MSGDQMNSRVVRGAGRLEARDQRSGNVIASLNGQALLRNCGIPLDLNWVQEVRVNTSAVERRAQSQVARRTVKKEWQAAWLLRAITCMDLTTLSGDDTEERVRRLCAKATATRCQQELVRETRHPGTRIQVGAVCVYHIFVETALQALEGSGDSASRPFPRDFPPGLSPLPERVAEIRRSVEAGRTKSTSSSPALTCSAAMAATL